MKCLRALNVTLVRPGAYRHIQLFNMSSEAASVPVGFPLSTSSAYKEKVLAMHGKKPSDVPQVVLPAGITPATHVLAHHSICLGVTSLTQSKDFYAKLGFTTIVSESTNFIRLQMPATGMQIDLIPAVSNAALPLGAVAVLAASEATVAQAATTTPPVPSNVLMDVVGWKAPGHTHASWSVPSVPSIKLFLAENNIPLSGTRSTFAIFVRDLDKTTLEFERNDGGDEPSDFKGASSIGFGRTLDHVGVRIRAPFDRHGI